MRIYIKNFSWGPFFIGAGAGFVVGVLALGIFVNYLISHALSSADLQGVPLSSVIEQVRTGIDRSKGEKESTVIYGHVVSIGDGTMVIKALQNNEEKNFTFKYDSATTFLYIANDAASSQLPLSADTLVVGDGLNVFAHEAIGSIANQYAVKIIKI